MKDILSGFFWELSDPPQELQVASSDNLRPLSLTYECIHDPYHLNNTCSGNPWRCFSIVHALHKVSDPKHS